MKTKLTQSEKEALRFANEKSSLPKTIFEAKIFISMRDSHVIMANVFGEICECKKKEDAPYIVKAVNMHDELIDSLKAIKMFVRTATEEYPVTGKSISLVIEKLLKQAEQK